MTILTAINQVCDIVTLDRFDSVYGMDDENAETMLALAKEAGDEIARRVDWQDMLKTRVAASALEALPDDWQRAISGGAVRTAAGEYHQLVSNGSLWTAINSTNSVSPFYFITGNQIALTPASTAVGSILDYVSKNWLIGDPYAEKDVITSDDDRTIFPERLLVKGIVWRWKRQKGLTYDDNLAEFEADIAQEIRADRGAS